MQVVQSDCCLVQEVQSDCCLAQVATVGMVLLMMQAVVLAQQQRRRQAASHLLVPVPLLPQHVVAARWALLALQMAGQTCQRMWQRGWVAVSAAEACYRRMDTGY